MSRRIAPAIPTSTDGMIGLHRRLRSGVLSIGATTRRSARGSVVAGRTGAAL